MSVYAQRDLAARRPRCARTSSSVDLVPPGSVVLDVGCASGYVARALLDRGARGGGRHRARPRSMPRRRVPSAAPSSSGRSRILPRSSGWPTAATTRSCSRDVVEHLRHPEEAAARPRPEAPRRRPRRPVGAECRPLVGAPRSAARTLPLRGRRPARPHPPPLLHAGDPRRAPRRRRLAARARGADLPRAAPARGRRRSASSGRSFARAYAALLRRSAGLLA